MQLPEIMTVNFFRLGSGKEPVRSWLKNLSPVERKLIGEDIKTVQWGWPLGMPLVRSLGHGLWEVRTNLPERTARVIFCIHQEHMVLLHGFIKKTKKTPEKEIDLAKQRKTML
jgi:phage-related protein